MTDTQTKNLYCALAALSQPATFPADVELAKNAIRAALDETKPKTEHVECPRCEGCGFLSDQGLDGYERRVPCRKCNGTGEVSAPTPYQVANAIIREAESEPEIERARR